MEQILVMQVIYSEACFRHMLEAVPLARYVQFIMALKICLFFYCIYILCFEKISLITVYFLLV